VGTGRYIRNSLIYAYSIHSKQFLTLGGAVLVVVALLGFVGIIGPAASDSLFGQFWWFDSGENWAHLILGVVALAAAFLLSTKLQKLLVQIVGVVGLLFAIYNIFSTSFLGANLESPADLVLHLAVGVWALWSARGPKAAAAPVMPSAPTMPGM